ncbi:uncharacterized protein TRUGW13939_02817 [Talaromyces rugulosus]|uniref:DUF3500 domain-containing protein n=1 Tax=Talaromyces rugulosus TaxID=121627 RepID=A0A7H8QP26_TALRU|nr:uncharacterized protein TRUGW13939_02817 [Talaromyces rugulosus]QKX55720.1 hypothetical protein TRUGW13939_02817 [Talaromyces rugulosus]
MSANFRDFIPPRDHPRVKNLDKTDVKSYSKNALGGPVVRKIVSNWAAKLDEPYFGITCDGKLRENLFELADEGAPVDQMVVCANRMIDLFTPTKLGQFCHEIDSDNWRKWSNPEFLIYSTGIRLEDLHENQIQAIMDLVQASTSSTGYSRIVGAMQTNEFLGALCGAKTILNKHSYQFSLYGKPSLTEPWGYSLFGHHLSLNIFVLGHQITTSPIFLGAEPNIIDSGPDAGVCILDTPGHLPLLLMQSLPPNLQKNAQIFKKMQDEKMPDDRWNPADQRHLAGAFQDNRIIPYEGIQATSMPQSQQDQLLQVLSFYLDILPTKAHLARMQQIKQHWEETYFCWIGGYGDDDAFYYRIQSPVILVEFDHHSGVFLLNKEPAKYHIHTIIRTPNGNDYGREWLQLHRKGSLILSSNQ